jgi:hypothetical protein
MSHDGQKIPKYARTLKGKDYYFFVNSRVGGMEENF